MNKSLPKIFVIVAVILIGYGIFTLIQPEASFSFGPIDIEEQDNTNAYITIGLGMLALVLSFITKKK
ncbi:hypothetical protein [Pontimicrobium sp. MEBiC01747]|jgi:LPXTG-motif cell wall-anchored protein